MMGMDIGQILNPGFSGSGSGFAGMMGGQNSGGMGNIQGLLQLIQQMLGQGRGGVGGIGARPSQIGSTPMPMRDINRGPPVMPSLQQAPGMGNPMAVGHTMTNQPLPIAGGLDNIQSILRMVQGGMGPMRGSSGRVSAF